MATIDSLDMVFEEQLKDLYSAETQLLKALPKLAKKASSPALKEAFESHLEETKVHVERLQQIGDDLNIKPTGKVCKAMQGLIEEGKEVLEEESENPALIDLMLITAAQKVEHYEISGYGTLCAIAKRLGHDDAVALLEDTLEEEGAADTKLTEITDNEVIEAASSDKEQEEEDEVVKPTAKSSKGGDQKKSSSANQNLR